MSELPVLLEQLDELLGEGVVDADDAYEVAVLAGLATRLGGGSAPGVLQAVAWRAAGGAELLTEAFEALDVAAIAEGLDGVLEGNADVEAVEEAVWELDDAVAAAIWSGHKKAVRELARAAAETIRQVPEPFASIADFGAEMARLAAVAADLDLYEYWLAIADAKAFADEG